MSLEQQLSDAIAAQNALTQAVASKQAGIDAAAAAAMQSTRVYSSNNLTCAKSLVSYVNFGRTFGVWIINTPIPRGSNTMAHFDIDGYDYGDSKIIGLSIVLYAYSGINAQDGVSGAFTSVSAQRRGNSAKSRIWLGHKNGNVAIAFGAINGENYCTDFTVDGRFKGGQPNTNPVDYSVDVNSSPDPAGAATGFGLINLLEI